MTCTPTHRLERRGRCLLAGRVSVSLLVRSVLGYNQQLQIVKFGPSTAPNCSRVQEQGLPLQQMPHSSSSAG